MTTPGRRTLARLTAAAALLAAGAAGFALVGGSHPPVEGRADPHAGGGHAPPARAAAGKVVTVKTVRPRHDPALRVSVEQLAAVEPYYHADLRARASGVVRAVTKDIGDRVRRGELLLEIDAPELEKDVEQKKAVVQQRREEARLAAAQIGSAEALIDVARATVAQRDAEVRSAEAAAEYRRRRLARFEALAARNAINADLVDETRREAESSAAEVEGARAAVRKAHADLTEKEASREQAVAEVELRKQLVEVSLKDLDRVMTVAGFARIAAPFDGVVTRRNVDPGDFVHDATRSGTEALLSVARTDIVTVTAKLPDNAAPFVGPDTEAVVRLDDLPGASITGRVTRFSPLIESRDRTMKVEIDLFNGGEGEYRLLCANTAAAGVATLGGRGPVGGVMALAAGRFVAHADHKGDREALPVRPAAAGDTLGGRRLLPGMTGYVSLRLNEFADAYLLPSTAVFSSGGKPYILTVEGGVTRLRPVRVQVDDGRAAKVVVMEKGPGGAEVPRELTAADRVVATRQQEIGDGQKVEASLTEW